MERRDWWLEFFSEPWLDLQATWWSDDENREQAERVQRLLHLPPSAHVLDVPCGDGRIALELAAAGHHVTAVDVSPSLLEAGRANATERGLDVEWVERDMRQFSSDGEFDAAFCWWGSFGFFEDEENARFADVVARSLKPRGRFLIETQVLETLLPRFKERFWAEKGGTLVLDERRWDHERSRLDTGWTFVRDGVAEKRHTSMRLYSYRELALLLESAGFSSIEGFDSQTLEPFALGASRLALVARKG